MARKNIDNVEEKKNLENPLSDDANQNNFNPNSSTTPESVDQSYLAYSRSRCGGALHIAREKQGLSLNDVASKLKISHKQIEALESDNFAALPESTIVRGFIRNYAKLLKLDAEPLLDAYNVLVPSKEPLAFMLKPSSNMKVNNYKKPKTGRYIALTLFLVIALGAWLFYQHYIEKPSPTAPTLNSEKIESLPQQALPAAERATEVAPSVEATSPVAGSETATTSAPISAPSVDSTKPLEALPSTPVTSATTNAQLILDPTAPSMTAAEAEKNLLRLDIGATQETWVSVKDASGKEIYNKIVFAGSRQALDAKPPLDVVFGNAAGASLTVNGKAVDLAPHTRANVVRLKLE